jgi:gamma-glutamyltranspeptidase
MTSTWGVASPHQAASGEAAEVLRQGGNAIDAALAAAAVLTVVYPHQCSVGGDVMALVGTASGSVHVIDGSGRSPAALGPEFITGGAMPVEGPFTVTVPGAVAAWFELADRYGTRPLSDPLRRAAELAEAGVPVAPGLGRALEREQARVVADPGMRNIFAAGGEILTAGQTLHQKELAATLNVVADGGPGAFYEGPTAESIVDTLRALGSPVTARDFSGHATWTGAALATTYADVEYLTAPPACQGAFFLEGLAALENVRHELGRDLDPLGEDAGLIALALEAAAADREDLLGDRDTSTLDVDWLLSTRADEVSRIALGQAPRSGSSASVKASGDTVAIVATDGMGNWISLIQSLFRAFGSGILDAASGVVLHNRGASFDLRPHSPNRLAGGRRPAHTLMPVLVRAEGRLIGAHGTMGGRAQPQIHTQVALNLARGASAHEAVALPRWVLSAMEAGVTDSPTLVKVEQDVPAPAVAGLSRHFLSETLPPHDDNAGHSQLVRSNGNDVLAATDPRADGTAHTG